MACTDFGTGVVLDEGGAIVAYRHTWPIKLFVYHFKGKGIETEEDWKAVIYSWGGPLPKFIDRVELKHNLKEQMVEIIFTRKEQVSVA